jgi:hypothetical protein
VGQYFAQRLRVGTRFPGNMLLLRGLIFGLESLVLFFVHQLCSGASRSCSFTPDEKKRIRVHGKLFRYRQFTKPIPQPSNSFCNPAMSSFFIRITAAVTRPAFSLSGLLIISLRAVGTICHDTPNLSANHPHCLAASSPPSPSLSQ